MSTSKPTRPRIHVVPDDKSPRRRRWSDDEKLQIVRESLRPGTVQAHLARLHGISPSQLCDWRSLHKAGLLGGTAGFSEVVPIADEAIDPAPVSVALADLVVDVGKRYRITIPSGYDMGAAAKLLRGLA